MIKRILAASAALAISAALAHAQEVKVGVEPALHRHRRRARRSRSTAAWSMYLKLNADKVKPYKITLIKRDDKNPAGDNSESRRRNC